MYRNTMHHLRMQQQRIEVLVWDHRKLQQTQKKRGGNPAVSEPLLFITILLFTTILIICEAQGSSALGEITEGKERRRTRSV